MVLQSSDSKLKYQKTEETDTYNLLFWDFDSTECGCIFEEVSELKPAYDEDVLDWFD